MTRLPHAHRPRPDERFWRGLRFALILEGVAAVLILLALFVGLPFVVLLLDAALN